MPANVHCRLRFKTVRRSDAKGYTLTELLVVIVIIAVLIALLFPLLTNMRENARSAKCVQNLRQIGIGLHRFISDNNGRFPNGGSDVSWLRDPETMDPFGMCWYDAAAENMSRENHSMRFNDPNAQPLPQCFGCPSGHGEAFHPAWPYTGDYAGNLFLGNNRNADNPLTLASVKNPGSTPYVQDTVKQNNFGPNIYSAGFSETSNFAFAARHNGKGNILWVDGHVSSMTYQDYMNFANSPKHGNPTNFLRGDW